MSASPPRPSALAITLCGYLLSLAVMATVGVIAPIVGRFADLMAVPVAAVGVAIGLFSLPSALASGLVGPVADFFGTRRMLVAASLFAAAVCLFLYRATSLLELRLGLLGAGVAFVGVVVSAPALLIEQLEGAARSRALSLWSSYAPAGFAVGLLLTSLFADGPHWRTGLPIVAALLVAGAAFAAVLPLRKVERAEGGPRRAGVGEIFAQFRNLGVVRLAIVAGVPAGISQGTSLLMPSYYTQVHGVSMAAASGVVAFAKLLIVICGGLVSGWLIARNVAAGRLFLLLVLVGVAAQFLLFYPGSGFVPAVGALAIWFFVYANMAGVAMAVLPTLLSDASRGAAATGLVSQITSCACFVASIIYFSGAAWSTLVLVAAAGLGACWLLLPKAGGASPAAPVTAQDA